MGRSRGFFFLAVPRLSLFSISAPPIPRSPSPGSGFQECTECPYLCPCKHEGEPAAEAAFLRRSQTDGSQHALPAPGASNSVLARERQCCRPAAGPGDCVCVPPSLRPSVWTNLNPLLCDASCCGFQLMGSGITSTACLFLSSEQCCSPDHFFLPLGGNLTGTKRILKTAPAVPRIDDRR